MDWDRLASVLGPVFMGIWRARRSGGGSVSKNTALEL